MHNGWLTLSTPKLDWVNSFTRRTLSAKCPEHAEESCWPSPYNLNGLSFNLHSNFWQNLQHWTKSDTQTTFTFWRENTQSAFQWVVLVNGLTSWQVKWVKIIDFTGRPSRSISNGYIFTPLRSFPPHHSTHIAIMKNTLLYCMHLLVSWRYHKLYTVQLGVSPLRSCSTTEHKEQLNLYFYQRSK